MIVPFGSLLIIVSIVVVTLGVVLWIPYYVGFFILLTITFLLRKQLPNHLFYIQHIALSFVFSLNFYFGIFLAKMLNNAGFKKTERVAVAGGLDSYMIVANNVTRDEALHPVDFTIRHRHFDCNNRVHSSNEKIKRQVANAFYKHGENNFSSKSESAVVLSPLNCNQDDRGLNSVACFNKLDRKFGGKKCSPTQMFGTLDKLNNPSISRSSSVGNRTSKLSQTYFEVDDGMKENVGVSSCSPNSSWDDISVLSRRYRLNSSLHSESENHRNQNIFYSRSYADLSPGKRHNDSSIGVLTHQSKYSGPGQLPRVCLRRPNSLLTFSGTILSKCVQSPVRAKPSTVLPKTRAYRLVSDSSPRFSANFKETSRKRIRNSHEEDGDDAAKRPCKTDEQSNFNGLEEDSINLKRAREDSPKSDLEQQHQKPKKRVCNNEILSSLSSSKNFLHTSARKRKAVVDWSRSSTPVQEKLFKKSFGSPDIVNNHQEGEISLTEDRSVPQQKPQPVVRAGSNESRTPEETTTSRLKNFVEKSHISNYTLFDVPVTLSDTSSIKENSPTSTYADLNTSLESVPKMYTDKKTFDTKELERQAILKRLSRFWDAFGSVDVNKAISAMAPHKSAHKLDGMATQLVTTSTPMVRVPSSTITTVQQPSLPNTQEDKNRNKSVNLVGNTELSKNTTSVEPLFSYGHSLSRSRELSSLGMNNLAENSAVNSPAVSTRSSETISVQNKFPISSSEPVISGPDVVTSLTGSNDLQRSQSAVCLSANMQSTPSSITSSTSEISVASVAETQSSLKQTGGIVLTSSAPSVASAASSNVTSDNPKPPFAFTSPFSSNMKNNSLEGKQNVNVGGENNAGGGGFTFGFSVPTVVSDGKSETLTNNFSVAQTTTTSSSTGLVLKSSSLAPSPGQGGFQFPITANNNHHQVDAAKSPNIFGISQTSSSGLGSTQTQSNETGISQTSLSGFGNVQTSSVSELNIPSSRVSSSGFGSVLPSSGFGSIQATSGDGFGNAQLSKNKPVFENAHAMPTSGFGSAQTPPSGFGSVQTPSSGFTSTQTTPSGFASAQKTPSGFGSAQATPSGFGSAQVTPSGFGSAQVTPSGFGSAQATPSGFGSAQATPSGFGSAQVTPSGFGSAQVTPSGFGSAQVTPSGFGSAQATPSGFGSAQATPSGFGSAQATPSGFGSAQATPSGFGIARATTSGFGSAQVTPSGFGSAQVTPSGFGSAQATPSGFGTAQATPSGFGSAQATQSGFGSSQATPSGFGSAQTTPSGFGSAQTTPSGFGSAQTTPSGFGSIQATQSVFGSAQATLSGSGNVPAISAAGFGSVPAVSSNIFGSSQISANSTVPFNFGTPNVQKTSSAFVFGASTVTTSSVDTPVQSSSSGNSITSSGQPQTSHVTLFTGGSDSSKNLTTADNTNNNPFAFSTINTTPKVGGFAFGNSNLSQVSTSSIVTNFGSNAAVSSQAPTLNAGTFSFGSPHSQSSGISMTQPQLSFSSGSGITSNFIQLPFASSQTQQSETTTKTSKPVFSFGTPQPSFGLTQPPQASFGVLQSQDSQSNSLMQQPQSAGVNPLLQNSGPQPSPFGMQTPSTGGGFSFTPSVQQQQQQQPQQTAPSSGLFGTPSQPSTFQFGSTPSATSQPVGGFSFGNPASSSSTVPAVNFSAGSNANSLFQAGTPSNFGGSSAGMFSIGSGSTAPRARSSVRSRRSMK